MENTSRGTRHCLGYYKTRRNPTHQRTRPLLNMCFPLNKHFVLNTKLLLPQLEAGRLDLLSWVMSFVMTTHFAPSNLVASLAPHLQWGEEVHPQKCQGTVSCACCLVIRTSLTHWLMNLFLHLTQDRNPNRKWPKTFLPSCWPRIYIVLGVDVLQLPRENVTKNQLFLYILGAP